MESIQVGRGDGRGVREKGTIPVSSSGITNDGRLRESSWPSLDGMLRFNDHSTQPAGIGFGAPMRPDFKFTIECLVGSTCFQQLQENHKKVQRVTADPTHEYKHECRWVIGDKVYMPKGVWVVSWSTEMSIDDQNSKATFELVADVVQVESSS